MVDVPPPKCHFCKSRLTFGWAFLCIFKMCQCVEKNMSMCSIIGNNVYFCIGFNHNTMDVERIREIINRQPNLSTALGMEFISTPDDDMCMATMKVDERNRQPFGFLSGGASLALAENLAGVGSSSLCPGKICVGINVSGSHVKAVAEGDTVTALARLVQKGKTLHVWNVEITDSQGRTISVVSVTNYIITPKKDAR